MRHTHATALLMAGVPDHVVSRRLGHADVQTTQDLYAHVTDDADMRAVAEWRAFAAGWRTERPGQPCHDRGPLMRETSSPGLTECLDAAAGGSRPQVLAGLWEAMPADMRLDRFALVTVPERHRDAFFRGRNAEIDLSGLPGPMKQELAWCLFRIAELGEIAGSPSLRTLVLRLREAVADLGSQAPGSLLDLPPREWQRHLARAVRRRTGVLPPTTSATSARRGLLRCYQLLWAQYDPRPWWQHEVWEPVSDPGIPRRPHEPLGGQAAHFHRIRTGWLRLGVQWYCKVSLETGALTWSTARHRLDRLTVFDAFAAARGIRDPWLAGEPAQVRVLMLDFLGHIRSLRVVRKGPTLGQPWSADHVRTALDSVEQFYAFMHDNKEAAAAALGEPGWLRLGPQHARFYRHGEKPRSRGPHGEHVIDDEALGQIMVGTGVLGAPAGEGGIGDEQAMRILMLLARTGRRVSELLLLDRDPLLPLSLPRPEPDGEPGAFTARFRYQQTKIDGAPDTILVDAEIVAIIKAQQEWADRFLDAHASPGSTPKYLFLAIRKNRNGQRPYPAETLRGVLRDGQARHPGFRRASGGLPAHPPLPAHQGHQPDQRRRPAARRPALPRAPVADHDHGLRKGSGIASDGRETAGQLVGLGAESVQVPGGTGLLTCFAFRTLPLDA